MRKKNRKEAKFLSLHTLAAALASAAPAATGSIMLYGMPLAGLPAKWISGEAVHKTGAPSGSFRPKGAPICCLTAIF